MSTQDRPIIIIRKKVAHAAHHGGAWKVAYADFVTAMMALFIVLWLMNSSVKIQQAISSYFRDPSGSGKESGSSTSGSGEGVSLREDEMPKLKEMLELAIKKTPDLVGLKDYVQMSVTGEGLRIELLENEKGIFFDSAKPEPNVTGRGMIERLSQELGKLPNDILIEGHTDARPFKSNTEYSNWELSTDRANAARRIMEKTGLRPNQIIQVRGFAAQNARIKDNPDDPSNRRISVIVRYQSLTPEDIAAANAVKKPDGESKKPEH
jgi:chemotaxis protein MotB